MTRTDEETVTEEQRIRGRGMYPVYCGGAGAKPWRVLAVDFAATQLNAHPTELPKTSVLDFSGLNAQLELLNLKLRCAVLEKDEFEVGSNLMFFAKPWDRTVSNELFPGRIRTYTWLRR